MKRTHIAIVLVMVLLFAMTLTACGTEKAPETTEATAATVAATVAPETTVPPQPLALTDWNLSASTWSSPNGATIHVTATPNYYAEGHSAAFVIRLESDEIANVPCEWNGTGYTASADLNAANGYCYYMLLTSGDGTVEEIAINTPAAPTNETLIDIEASLESYCSVTVEESSISDNQLTLSSGTVQVQAPVITNEGEVITCQEAQLLLSFQGEALDKKVLTLEQGETNGLFEAALENIVFDIPEMEAEQSVELTLNVTLSNGQVLNAFGGNWIRGEEGLLPVVG